MLQTAIRYNRQPPLVQEYGRFFFFLFRADPEFILELRLEEYFLNLLRQLKQVIVVVLYQEILFPAPLLVFPETGRQDGFRPLIFFIQLFQRCLPPFPRARRLLPF